MNDCGRCEHKNTRIYSEPCRFCEDNSEFVMKRFTDDELIQIFENKFDCYADTVDESAVMAMTKERFIEVVRELLTKEE